MELKEGSKVPAFLLDSSNGKKIRLSEIKTDNLVIYFYPRDDTPGCTNEAIDFSKLKNKFMKLNAEIYGISPDPIEKHIKFINKYKLKITLLSDTENKIAQKYGVWKEKSLYGKKYMGIERSTFLISKQRKIIKCWKKVKVRGHAEEVYNELISYK